MKIPLRFKTAFVIVCSLTSLRATPLLFVNYNPPMTQSAQTRAAALGLEYDTIADFTSVSNLAGSSVVIMPGFSNYANLLHQTTVLRDFVHAGGYLWINVAGDGCAEDFAPGGVDFLQYSCGGSYNQSEALVNPAHAYVQGAFNPKAKPLTADDFMNWNVTDLGASLRAALECDHHHAESEWRDSGRICVWSRLGRGQHIDLRLGRRRGQGCPHGQHAPLCREPNA